MTVPRRFSLDELRAFAGAIFERVGVAPEDAALVADSLVVADAWGHASHGLLRLPWYVSRIRNGVIDPLSPAETVHAAGAIAVVDGRDGVGQVLAGRAMRQAVALAREHGVGAVAVRNSNHFGTAAYFTRMAADAGAIGILLTNASPAMAPWGGRERKVVGTNPWSIAAPAGGRGVAVLDIANTAVARGKVYEARQRGLPIPEGWALNAAGEPTTDPLEAIAGLISPMAGHKGYVIAFMVDALAGVLTGSGFGSRVRGPFEPDRRSRCGHLAIALDVASFSDLDSFSARMGAWIDEVKSVPTAAGVEEVFFPGELENRALARAEREGVDLPQQTVDELREVASALSVELTL